MFNDKMQGNFSANDNITIQTPVDSDQFNPRRHWEVIDTIINSDGSKETRNYFNTVVNDCSRVIASLMKGHKGFSGITYWAVGSGEPLWNNENPPTPSIDDAKLTNETFRKLIPPENIVFLNSANEVVEEVTNKLQITIDFNEGEANGELREFGLYGGDAKDTKGSGIMVNHKIHPLIYKTSGMKLQRIIRITF